MYPDRDFQRYTISALIPEPWASEFLGWRKEYDRWSNSWLPPHITIIPPFQAAVPPSILAEIERTPLTIPVSFGKWGSYDRPNSHVIWVDPGQEGPKAARKQLLDAYPEFQKYLRDPADGERYHVTIVNRVPDSDFTRIFSELQQKKVEGTFEIPQLTVFVWDRLTSRWLYNTPR